MCGDPGTSKSQLLQYVHKIASRGIYTSGRGSSAVGLTAFVTRDPDTRQLVLESGALVLSDGGVCCIDEFDKMTDGTRSVLHEVMEQQTVSIAKAGIICTLNARTSILAAANPHESQWNSKASVVDNIQLPPTLLSRFDLIYLILDKPDAVNDMRLARHIVSLYRDASARGTMGAQDTADAADSLDNVETLAGYISYARRCVRPRLDREDVARMLVDGYVAMRDRGGGRKTITATPRQLESLIRIAEALARMRLSEQVEPADVTEALRLVDVALHQAATDPATGQIDIGLLTTGQSAVERARLANLARVVRDYCVRQERQNFRFSQLLADLNQQSSIEISTEDLERALEQLVQEDVVAVTGARHSANHMVRVL